MTNSISNSTGRRKVSDWQPIETAPKDGTRLLLATPTGKVADGMWSTRYEVWSWPYVMAEPTHWMPAPPIPTIAHFDPAFDKMIRNEAVRVD